MWPHPVFSCCLGWFPTTNAELSSCSVDHRPCRDWNKVLYRKSLLTLVSVHLNKLGDIHAALSPTAKFPHARIPVFSPFIKNFFQGPLQTFSPLQSHSWSCQLKIALFLFVPILHCFSISFVFFFFNPVISEIIYLFPFSIWGSGSQAISYSLYLHSLPPIDQGII